MINSGAVYDENWQNNYSSMIASAQEAVARVCPGQRVFIGTGCAQPQVLIEALLSTANGL